MIARMKLSFLVLFIGAIAFSCSSDKKDGGDLPPASGISGDMYLVMDSVQWKGPLGKTIDSLFTADMRGLPRDEAIYNMLWIDPRKLNFVLKQRRNLIIAVTLDKKTAGASVIKRMFTKESIDKIKSDPDFFYKAQSHVYAKNQEVMYLFGKTEQDLLTNLKKKGSLIVSHFDRVERDRLTKQLFKGDQNKGPAPIARKKFNCDIKFPFGYRVADSKPDFFWVRQINSRDDKDVFIARTKFTSQDQFKKENLISFRNHICEKYLFEDPDKPDSYLVTETNVPLIPVTADTINFNGHFAIELRGLWKTNTLTMGGPFVGYALADESAGEFYYIEGFVYSPARDQRELVRELETILYTFRTSEDLKKEEKKPAKS
jgi:hypothetical protein